MPSQKETFARRIKQLLESATEIAALAEMLDEEVDHFADYLATEFGAERTGDQEGLAEDRDVLLADATRAMMDVAPIRGQLVKVLSEMTANSKMNVLAAMKARIKRK